MISRRDKLLNHPWQQQRYEQHRDKVSSAKPAIDVKTPKRYAHVTVKPKKIQFEKERLKRIETENVRLLQKLGDIMRMKRLQNFWLQPRPNFLHREKLFETKPRPHTSLPQLTAIYAPTLKSPKLFTAARCPTCSGKPDRTEVKIPERRIPWEPARKSWNCKTMEVTVVRKCMHCGHAKEQ